MASAFFPTAQPAFRTNHSASQTIFAEEALPSMALQMLRSWNSGKRSEEIETIKPAAARNRSLRDNERFMSLVAGDLDNPDNKAEVQKHRKILSEAAQQQGTSPAPPKAFDHLAVTNAQMIDLGFASREKWFIDEVFPEFRGASLETRKFLIDRLTHLRRNSQELESWRRPLRRLLEQYRTMDKLKAINDLRCLGAEISQFQ